MIPVAIPPVAPLAPAAAIEVITIPRGFLRPRACRKNRKPCGEKKSFSHLDLPSKKLEEEAQLSLYPFEAPWRSCAMTHEGEQVTGPLVPAMAAGASSYLAPGLY